MIEVQCSMKRMTSRNGTRMTLFICCQDGSVFVTPANVLRLLPLGNKRFEVHKQNARTYGYSHSPHSNERLVDLYFTTSRVPDSIPLVGIETLRLQREQKKNNISDSVRRKRL